MDDKDMRLFTCGIVGEDKILLLIPRLLILLVTSLPVYIFCIGEK